MLLKLPAPIFPAPEPLKSMVDPVAANVPLLVQLPPTVWVNDPAVKLLVMLTFPATASAPAAVFTPAPLNVTLLKLPAPMLPVPEPLKSMVEPAAVNVPLFVQFPPTVWVKEPGVKLLEMLTLPAIVKIPVAVLVPEPLNVTLLKLQAPILAVPDPVKSTVELFAVKVPLFVQLPETVSVFDPVMVSEAPDSIVILLHTAPVVPMEG